MEDGSPQAQAMLDACGQHDCCTASYAVIMPTTLSHLDAVGDLALQTSLDLVVARHGWKSSITPADLLNHLSNNCITSIKRIAVFTDQLVSALDAPLLARRGPRTKHVSSIEHILNSHYRMPLIIPAGDQVKFLPAQSSPHLVFNAIPDYFDACDQLGGARLARNAQTQRPPQERRLEQKRRVQAMRSSILHLTGHNHSPWDTTHESKLQILDNLYRER